jgi:hypothetical protein
VASRILVKMLVEWLWWPGFAGRSGSGGFASPSIGSAGIMIPWDVL